MSFSNQCVIDGSYAYHTTESHFDNIVTMSDFLNYELGGDSGYEVINVDGTYAEIQCVDTGEIYAVHAGGLGDSNNHLIKFEKL